MWLELEVDSIVLSPRERLVSVPYAMQAGSVGAGSIGFNQLAQPYQAGRIELRDLVTAGPSFFVSSPTLSLSRVISFSAPFSALPMFSANLLIPDLFTAADTTLTPIRTSLSNATVNLVLPRVHQRTGDFLGAVRSANIVDGRPAKVSWVLDVFTFGEYILYFQIAADAKGEQWNDPVMVLTDPKEFSSASLATIDGHPAIAYAIESSNAVYYVRALDAQGATWGTPVQLSASDSIVFANLIEVNNRPALTFETRFNAAGVQSNSVWYAVANDATGASWNAPQQLDYIVNTNSAGVGGYTPRLIMANTLPAVVYSRHYENPHSYSLHFRRAGAIHGTGPWGSDVTIFTNAGVLFSSVPFAVHEVDGHPAVVVLDEAPTPLVRYIRADDANGSSWPVGEVAMNQGVSGRDSLSLSFRSGRAEVAAITPGQILYRRKATGTLWLSLRDLTHPNISPGSIIFLREVAGQPAIFYQDRFLRSTQVPEGSLNWMAVQP